MARTVEEQRQYNREKQRAYRDKKRAATSGQQTPGVVVPDGDTVATPGGVDDTLTVDVNTGSDAPKLSFVERTKQKLGIGQSATPPARIVKKAKKQENLLTSTVPTVLCAFISTYSRELIADPYKSCAPSQEEATGILGPLFDILARQVEITGRMSQTTIDLTNSLICALLFGIRSYMTYTQIKSKEIPTHAKETTSTPQRGGVAERNDSSSEHLAGGMRSHQAASTGSGGNNHSQYAATENAYATETYDASSNANFADGHTEGRDHEAALVSSMFQRDIQGRQRLGLLAVPVRDDS